MDSKMMTIGIDPGFREMGCSVFRGTELIAAQLIENPTKKGHDYKAAKSMFWALVDYLKHEGVTGTSNYLMYGEPLDINMCIEAPQVYRASLQKGDPNILVALAGFSYTMATLAENPILYKPKEWKGNLPKEIMLNRIEAKLTTAERGRIQCRLKSKLHNVQDAVGIGLYHLGRLK